MKWRKVVSFTVIAACMFTVPASAMAKGGKTEAPKGKVIHEVKVNIEKTTESTGESMKEKLKDKGWKVVKDGLQAEKDGIEVEKNLIEGKVIELEAAYEAAKATGDEAAIKAALEAMTAAKSEMTELKAQMNAIKAQMKEVIRNKYTQGEFDALKQVAAEIQKEGTDVTVIPVENIFSKKGNFKFDVPPVIKQGRTLIPVRAITEGLGAQVEWNAEDQTVTIKKDGVEIVFNLKTGVVQVNGVAQTIDVPATLISNRTMVPLRFIAEQLKLKVAYDGETGVIDIEEEPTSETGATTEPTDSTTVENQEETTGSNTTTNDDTIVAVEPDTTVTNVEPVAAAQ